mgnify:CR=1 FL=1
MSDLSASTCDYLALANKGVQNLHPYQPGKPIEELERELGLTDIVKLASNENPLGISVSASKAIQNELANTTLYPDGTGFALKKALSDRFKFDVASITLGNGSNDVLDIIARAYANAESEVIYSQYAFAVYALSTQLVNAKAVVTPALDWGHDLDAMRAAITDKTSLIFIANPNNPTGTYLPSSQLVSFLESVPEHIVIVLDEAYCEYIDEPDYPNGLSLLAMFPNLIVTRTFSKAYGLAALRVGYAVSNPVITDILNRVRQPFNVNSFALAAAKAVLSDAEYLEQAKRVNKAGLQQVEKGLQMLGLNFIPSLGNFICFELAQEGVVVYQALLEKGVIVRPLANYGMPNHLRVSIGLENENQRFLEALASVLASKKQS